MPRQIIALLLTVVYLTIVMGPLAPLALRSPAVAHALTGECAGDCRTCGCSSERSASRTCCCWQKKLRQEREKEEHEQRPGDCCKKKKGHGARVTISECPCGSAKLIAFSGADKDELLPFHFSGSVINRHVSVRVAPYPRRLSDRHVAPPDPPPKPVSLS